MKKLATILICLVMCVLFVGCENEKESFVFDDFGIEVKMLLGAHAKASHDNESLIINNAEKGYYLGVISVDKQKDKNINEIYDTYIIGDGEKIKTELSDNLIFVEIINKVDSVALGERVDKAYCFIFYDESTCALLFGRFSENSERDYVISLAKSIEVVKK